MEKEIIGKKVKVIWEDREKNQIRVGKAISMSDKFLTLDSDNRKELIPLTRIIRIQVQGGNN